MKPGWKSINHINPPSLNYFNFLVLEELDLCSPLCQVLRWVTYKVSLLKAALGPHDSLSFLPDQHEPPLEDVSACTSVNPGEQCEVHCKSPFTGAKTEVP